MADRALLAPRARRRVVCPGCTGKRDGQRPVSGPADRAMRLGAAGAGTGAGAGTAWDFCRAGDRGRPRA
ncbi:hypothetical protein NL676_008661 [Syzygium grande]|nr:hypothetical protein NL676_008661 [Syzygium grande]